MIQETVADSKKSILFSLILKKIYEAYKFIHWFVYSNIFPTKQWDKIESGSYLPDCIYGCT